MVVCIYVIIVILQAVEVNSQSPAILSVTNVIPGATATFECSHPSLTSSASLEIKKDKVAVYQCLNIVFPCSMTSLDNDYSDVTFTNLGAPLAKGTFTVANADQTRDGGGWTCNYGTSLISSTETFAVSAPATLSVKNVLHGETATFKCSHPSLTSPTTLDIYKDSVVVYQCANIALTCSKASPDNDYSDVSFTALGTASATGTFTVANADQTRDGGDWMCTYGSSVISPSVTFVVSDVSLWCSFPEDGDNWPCIVLIICLICGGIGTVVGIWLCCVCCSCCYFLNKQTVHDTESQPPQPVLNTIVNVNNDGPISEATKKDTKKPT